MKCSYNTIAFIYWPYIQRNRCLTEVNACAINPWWATSHGLVAQAFLHFVCTFVTVQWPVWTVTPCWLLFTSLTAACARKSQNSDFAHVCLGFITQKQRDNTSRRQRVNSNPCCVTVHSVTSNTCTETAKQRFRAGCPRVCHAKNTWKRLAVAWVWKVTNCYEEMDKV